MPNNTTENTPTADPIRELLEQILSRIGAVETRLSTFEDDRKRETQKLDTMLSAIAELSEGQKDILARLDRFEGILAELSLVAVETQSQMRRIVSRIDQLERRAA